MEEKINKIGDTGREMLASRMGFILLSAGCAIGLGNIWRFPYITGLYGGATFVIVYIVFLVILGIPVMTMEFGVGRGSGKSVARAMDTLQPKGMKWGLYGYFAVAGNYLLMMFYTTITGWLIYYFVKMMRGDFVGASADEVGGQFGALVSSPQLCITFMIIACVIGFCICLGGVQKSVERITKVMMVCLLVIMVVLVVRAVTLPGAAAGLEFYLKPSLEPFRVHGVFTILFAAMGQAFFTLSLGIGSMLIFGSYLKKERSLTGEAINVTVLDTFVAIMAGLIIFPACFAFGVEPGAGPGLIFVTLPNIFADMAGGRFWGSLFFLFMVFAAISTVIAVFENIVASGMDRNGWSRKKSVGINIILVPLLSIPCALGFNLWEGFDPMGAGTDVIDIEDFILSQNLLPLGSLIVVLFCMSKKGWGWKNFLAEVDAGKGLKFPARLKVYFKYVLPVIIILLFIGGYLSTFTELLG